MKSMGQLEKQGKSSTTTKQNPNETYYQESLQNTDEEYQKITYWKHGEFETVSGLKFTPIDLQKALHETEKLLEKYHESIGFSNGRNKDAIHITRNAKDQWAVQCPIFTRDEWDGYYWRTTTNTKKILDVIRLFFDELEWFDMLDFKMDKNSD